jgi:hypothetical protein
MSHAEVLVRPERDEPWARTVAVSIGRTEAEAAARADANLRSRTSVTPAKGACSARWNSVRTA